MKIPVTIEGTEYQFIFDTGAMGTVIQSSKASAINRSISRIDTAYDNTNNMVIVPLYTINAMKIGSTTLDSVSIYGIPDNELLESLGVDGIIGVNVIAQFDWLFDCKNHLLQKIDTALNYQNNLDDFVGISYYENNLRPIIQIDIDGKIIDCLFDTGARFNDISQNDYKKIETSAYEIVTQKRALAGLFSEGIIESTEFSLPVLLPKLSAVHYEAKFNVIETGENKIGMSFWNQNRVFFSWQKGILMMNPEYCSAPKSFAIKFDYKDETIVISTIHETSEIEQLEIEIGTKVQSINGRTFHSKLDLFQFMGSENLHELSVMLENGTVFRLTKS